MKFVGGKVSCIGFLSLTFLLLLFFRWILTHQSKLLPSRNNGLASTFHQWNLAYCEIFVYPGGGDSAGGLAIPLQKKNSCARGKIPRKIKFQQCLIRRREASNTNMHGTHLTSTSNHNQRRRRGRGTYKVFSSNKNFCPSIYLSWNIIMGVGICEDSDPFLFIFFFY